MSDKFHKHRLIGGNYLFGVYWEGSEVMIEAEFTDDPHYPSLFLVFPDGSEESGSRFEQIAVFDSWEARDKFVEAMNAVIAHFVADAMRKDDEKHKTYEP